jgi:hypothetical protein
MSWGRGLVVVLLIAVWGGCGGDKAPMSSSPATPRTDAEVDSADWEVIRGDHASLRLPDRFKGGDPDIEAIAEQLDELGEDFEPFANVIRQNSSFYDLFAVDTEGDPLAGATNVIAYGEERPLSVTLDDAVSELRRMLPRNFSITGVSERRINGRDTRLVYVTLLLENTRIGDVEGRELVYITRFGPEIWYVVFATSRADYDDLLETFEESYSTFTIGE